MSLNLHQVRLFNAVAHHKSFSRAAEALFISQPAVSKGVRDLERQLGMPLLDRSRQVVTLTEAGETLFSYAQQLFATEHAAQTALDQLRDLERGHIAIGASPTIGVYLLPELLGTFARVYPKVQLFLDVGTTREIVTRLRLTPMDVAYIEGSIEARDAEVGGLHVTPWRADSLVVIAAPNHALARMRPVPLHLIAAEPFVQREPGSATREIIDDGLRARGITLQVALEVGSTEGLKQLVAAGIGLGIVSRFTTLAEVDAGRLVVLDAPELSLRRWLSRVEVIGRPSSAALRAFLALSDAKRDSPALPQRSGR